MLGLLHCFHAILWARVFTIVVFIVERAPEFRDSTMLLSAIVHPVAVTSLSSFCEFLLSTPSPFVNLHSLVVIQ